MKQNKKLTKHFRMFILVQEEPMQRPRWIEVDEINLGSLNKPNRIIKQVRIEPIEPEGLAGDFMNKFFRED